MPVNVDELRHAVESELSQVSDERVVARIRDSLTAPTILMRCYEFTTPPVFHPCWLVWKSLEKERGIAFSEFGFGPRRPWGAIYTSGAQQYHSSMGADDYWHRSFLEAWLDESPPVDLPIWRISRSSGGVVEYLSGLGDWTLQWKAVSLLRAHDHGVFYYTVDTDVFPRKRRFSPKRQII